jgi:hypothetical protein
MGEMLLLEEWKERFGIAGSSNERLNKEVLKDSKVLQEVAKNFKSPTKISQQATDQEIDEFLAMVDPNEFYERKINSSGDMKQVAVEDYKFLVEILRRIEEKLEELSRKTVINDAKTEQVSKKIKLELPVLFTKTHNLDTTIGNRVKYDSTKLSAPMVWSSIALLTTLLHDTQSKVHQLPKITEEMKRS